MARKEHKRTPKVIGRILYTNSDAVSLDSPAWFDWLANHTTFYLKSPDGTFTARRERRDDAFFWYAFADIGSNFSRSIWADRSISPASDC